MASEFEGHVLTEPVTTLPGECYTSPDVFAREARAIFSKRWLCAGRAAAIPRPGDYALFDAAGESLILVRGKDGRLRAVFNVCRHRGTRVCESPGGHFAGGIQCPYHAWTYGLDGALLGAPHMTDVAWFDKTAYPLVAASVAEWEGFVFVHLDGPPEAPPLEDTLRPILGRFAPWRLGSLVSAHLCWRTSRP